MTSTENVCFAVKISLRPSGSIVECLWKHASHLRIDCSMTML